MVELNNSGEVRFSKLLNDIEKSVQNDLLYVAIMTSITIPDIAGAISSRNGNANKNKYIDWFDKYCAQKYKIYDYSLTGEDCYYLRCSLLHQGKAEHKNLEKYSDIVFSKMPKSSESIIPIILTSEKLLVIEPNAFCKKMVSAGYEWLNLVYEDKNFKKNTEKLIKLFTFSFE